MAAAAPQALTDIGSSQFSSFVSKCEPSRLQVAFTCIIPTIAINIVGDAVAVINNILIYSIINH